MGRRLYRGVVFALLVGLVGGGMSVAPGLFVQSIFIGNAQRCEQQQEFDLALEGEIVTECGQDVAEVPQWLPPTIIAGGAIAGLLGGFAYGFISPTSGRREWELTEPLLTRSRNR